MDDRNDLMNFGTEPTGNAPDGLHDGLAASLAAAEPEAGSGGGPVTGNHTHRRREGRHTRLLAWAMAGSILMSGAMGFGGGYLAFQMGESSRPAATAAAAAVTSPATTSSTPAASADTAAALAAASAASKLQTVASSTSQGGNLPITQIAAKAAPSVVEIQTEVVVSGQRSQSVAEAAGSGVIITADGTIVTNNHVIEGARKITVRLTTGATFDATLVGTDTQKDIAIIKIAATGLTPATIGKSSSLLVGDLAVAIGNPLGELGGTVTDGIISALDREITLEGETMNLLQTNASINPGNSGGGLFDGQGNLIGIVVAKSSGTGVEGLGFAIPIDDAVPVIQELRSYGYVRGRIDLGLTLVDITSQQTALMYRVSTPGVYISEISSSGSAAKAGFASGDRIVSIDGTNVSSTADINKIIEKHAVGDTISVIVARSRQSMSISLTLQESRPAGI